MLHIGIDDTDSVNEGCTTWLATEITKELSDFDLIGSPRLVRLNPNVPWKTRGNGAVSFTFGKGKGNKKKIYISRQNCNYRNLVNENDILSYLTQLTNLTNLLN